MTDEPNKESSTEFEKQSETPRRKNQLRYVEIYDLEVVLAVAEMGSFRKACGHLGTSQSAVSRRIRKLEDELGVSLFERSTSGVRLTVAGWRFQEQARLITQLFREVVEVNSAAGVARKGRLHLGVIASLSRGVLREAIAKFTEMLPDVEVRIVEAERGELMTLLSHRRLDAVMAAGIFSSEASDSLVLAREPIFAALPENHPLAEQSQLDWEDLNGAQFIVSSNEPGPEIHDYLVGRLADFGAPLRVTQHRTGREGLMNLVGLGFGISLVADHWRGVRYPNVTFVRVGAPDENVPFSLTWVAENDNPALRRFISVARVAAEEVGKSSA